MSAQRKCTRCIRGTETCVVGDFYICDSCDEEKKEEATPEHVERETTEKYAGGSWSIDTSKVHQHGRLLFTNTHGIVPLAPGQTMVNLPPIPAQQPQKFYVFINAMPIFCYENQHDAVLVSDYYNAHNTPSSVGTEAPYLDPLRLATCNQHRYAIQDAAKWRNSAKQKPPQRAAYKPADSYEIDDSDYGVKLDDEGSP